jgi:hypothetical protein
VPVLVVEQAAGGVSKLKKSKLRKSVTTQKRTESLNRLLCFSSCRASQRFDWLASLEVVYHGFTANLAHQHLLKWQLPQSCPLLGGTLKSFCDTRVVFVWLFSRQESASSHLS